jgi:hypothetical protein
VFIRFHSPFTYLPRNILSIKVIITTSGMASNLDEKTISERYWGYVNSFQRFFEDLQKNGDIADKLRGAVGQLRVWVENFGAHRKRGNLSLDHKLREAKRFRGHVKNLLVDLGVVVDEGTCL